MLFIWTKESCWRRLSREPWFPPVHGFRSLSMVYSQQFFNTNTYITTVQISTQFAHLLANNDEVFDHQYLLYTWHQRHIIAAQRGVHKSMQKQPNFYWLEHLVQTLHLPYTSLCVHLSVWYPNYLVWCLTRCLSAGYLDHLTRHEWPRRARETRARFHMAACVSERGPTKQCRRKVEGQFERNGGD